jgi:hypothetical protein
MSNNIKNKYLLLLLLEEKLKLMDKFMYQHNLNLVLLLELEELIN